MTYGVSQAVLILYVRETVRESESAWLRASLFLTSLFGMDSWNGTHRNKLTRIVKTAEKMAGRQQKQLDDLYTEKTCQSLMTKHLSSLSCRGSSIQHVQHTTVNLDMNALTVVKLRGLCSVVVMFILWKSSLSWTVKFILFHPILLFY